jgi:hypothetical protein
MADSYKTLYQGQLTTSAAAVYTATGVQAIVKGMRWRNTDGSNAIIVTIYKNGTTTAFEWLKFTIPAGGSAEWDGTEALDNGETIGAKAGSGALINMIVSGDEIS